MDWIFFSFSTLKMSLYCPRFLVKSHSFNYFPLYMKYHFSGCFQEYSLYVCSFSSFTMMWVGMDFFLFWGSLNFLNLSIYILNPIWETFCHYFFKYFLSYSPSSLLLGLELLICQTRAITLARRVIFLESLFLRPMYFSWGRSLGLVVGLHCIPIWKETWLACRSGPL